MLTNDELNEIEARVKAATIGPWDYAGQGWVRHGDMSIPNDKFDDVLAATVYTEEDGVFVAAARTDVPILIQALRDEHETNRELYGEVRALFMEAIESETVKRYVEGCLSSRNAEIERLTHELNMSNQAGAALVGLNREATTAALKSETARRMLRDELADLRSKVLDLVEQAWDDGNATGLDGWVGPGRGTRDVDPEAHQARDRMKEKAEKFMYGEDL